MPTILSEPRNPEGDMDLTALAKDLADRSPGQQMALGGLTGFISGYIMGKFGKWAAITIGSGLLLLQIASYTGYVKVNWREVDTTFEQARRRLQKELSPRKDALPDSVELKKHLRRYGYFAGGAAAGALLGFGSA